LDGLAKNIGSVGDEGGGKNQQRKSNKTHLLSNEVTLGRTVFACSRAQDSRLAIYRVSNIRPMVLSCWNNLLPAYDALLALSVLLAVALISETIIRRREGRKP